MTRINTNVSSLNAQKTLAKNQASLNQAMTRLSTGLRINSGADDPSGMIAAAIQSNDIAAMQTAITNTQNGSMLISTADSALGQITNLLTDIRGLVTQVTNTAVVNSDMIAANQLQVDSALQAIDRISQVTKFQGQSILDGTLDFINNAQTIPQIQNLNITQANLGTTGTLNVAVEVSAHAERADITTSSGEKQATTALKFAARGAVDVTGGNVILSTTSNSSQYDGIQVQIDAAGTAAGSVFYDESTNILTISTDGTTTWSTVGTLLANEATTKDLFVLAYSADNTATAGNTTLHQESIEITADTKGIDFNDVKVTVTHSTMTAAHAPVVTYNEAGKELTINLNDAVTGAADRYSNGNTLAQIKTAIDNTNFFTATISATAGTNDRIFGSVTTDQRAVANTSATGYLNSSFSASTNATATISLAAGANVTGYTTATLSYPATAGVPGTYSITSNTAGVADVAITFTAGAAKGAEVVTYNAANHTLNVQVAEGANSGVASTIAQVLTAINTDGNFTMTNLTGVAANGYFAVGDAALMGTTNTDGGANLDIKATSLSAAQDNVKITIMNDAAISVGSEYAEYDALGKSLTVHVVTGAAGSSMAQVVNAINNSTDSVTGLASGAWKATNLNPTAAAGVSAFVTAPSQFYTSTDTVTVQALNVGANYNNMQVKFQTVDTLSGALASYDQTNNIFTIQVKGSETRGDQVTLQQIVTAINGVDGFAGSFSSKNAASGTPQASGIIFGKNIDTTAIANTGTTGGNTLLGDLTLEVGAGDGQQVFTWKAGTSSNQVASAINAVSDAIGAVAYVNNDLVDFKSAAYGSKSFISLNVINEATTGLFKRSVSSFRDTGTDADAKINGLTASSSGNQISINTSSLGMSIDLLAETNGNFNFAITGGGAQFQLGPDVVSNQQLRIGIQSVNTARLGGVNGRLYQLAEGNNADLDSNPNLAAKIVDEAGTAITTLRGRLGAIQGLTMLSNQNTLEDMVQNMQTSLSLIQDTDFAAETANLTRAQILTQANMSVLSIANQQPQQVLSLLPRG